MVCQALPWIRCGILSGGLHQMGRGKHMFAPRVRIDGKYQP